MWPFSAYAFGAGESRGNGGRSHAVFSLSLGRSGQAQSASSNAHSSVKGRSRPSRVSIPYARARTALAIAFNDKCDVIVATVLAEEAGEGAALVFLNSDLVRRAYLGM